MNLPPRVPYFLFLVFVGLLLSAPAMGASFFPPLFGLIPSSASRLSAWSHFAALATAISLAYANLESFRYRDKVRDYVKKILDEEGVKANLTQALTRDKTNYWAHLLVTIGRLNAADLGRGWDVEVHKQARSAYIRQPVIFLFRNFYGVNADKILAVCLGVFASWVIWFAALDDVYFPDPVLNDPERCRFLSGMMIGVGVALASGLLAFACFRISRPGKRDREDLVGDTGKNVQDGPNKKIPKQGRRVWSFFGGAFILNGTIFFVAACLNHVPYRIELSQALMPNVEVWVATLVGVPLSLANVVPLFLVIAGDWLTRRMSRRADDCRTMLGTRPIGKIRRKEIKRAKNKKGDIGHLPAEPSGSGGSGNDIVKHDDGSSTKPSNPTSRVPGIH